MMSDLELAHQVLALIRVVSRVGKHMVRLQMLGEEAAVVPDERDKAEGYGCKGGL